MKFKAAFSYRGLCETALLEASYDNYRQLGSKLVEDCGLDELPDFFILQGQRWLKLDERGEIMNFEFSAADYCRASEMEEMAEA